MGVTHVLNLAKELEHVVPEHVHRKFIGLVDTVEEDISAYFREAVEWVHAAISNQGKVLVHCFEGKSRSVTVVLAYLMMKAGMTLAAGLALVQRAHPIAKPNPAFMAKLSALDVELHGADSLPKEAQTKMAKAEERRKYLEQRLQKRGGKSS
mmetsp:Transcript_65746/g.208088  ORF Transcript_65746/g.208088 Transcript_65746/m.208088 type:complete len:152 (-) Transcript_65746:18-473(-)